MLDGKGMHQGLLISVLSSCLKTAQQVYSRAHLLLSLCFFSNLNIHPSVDAHPKEFSTNTMRIVKRYSPRVKYHSDHHEGESLRMPLRTLTQTVTLLEWPFPSSPCSENLNDLTTKRNLGRTPGKWAGGLHFSFHALSSWFLRAFSFPFILLIFWLFYKRKAPWQLKLPCVCQSKSRGSLLRYSVFWHADQMLQMKLGHEGPAIILSRQAWLKGQWD